MTGTEPQRAALRDLPRKLGLSDATAIVIGIVIGAGIFIFPAVIARQLTSPAAILAVWIVSGLLSYCGALAYAELGAMLPATGGQYVYLREAYGPLCAFVCGWTLMLAVTSGGIGFLAAAFSVYLGQFVPLSLPAAKAVSLALIAVLSAINYIGVREGAFVQRMFTGLKIGGVLLLVVSAFWGHHAPPPGAPELPEVPFSLANFGVAMTACLMAYNGWSYVSFVAGEVRQPQRNLPRALALGMVAVGALYVLANVAYLKVLTISEIRLTERVGALLAQRTMGAAGATILSVTVMLSAIGAINGNLLTAARIPFAQARDGLFFHRFGHIHPRFETPSFAIVMQGLWAGVLVLSGTYQFIVSYATVAAWIFYVLTVGAVPILRRKLPNLPRPCRMRGYPYTLALFLLVGVWFVVNAFINQPGPSLAALGIVTTGVPAYWFWKAKS
jgi:APA family basic amino acid/polyamine antiporter